MKKLIYNDNTKEINIVKEELKKRKKVKKFFKRNKIYLEVFSMTIVGIMGIIISFVGWRTDRRNSEIYQKQLEILQNDREPYFTIKCETILHNYLEEGYYAQNKYTIKNEGGMISEAFIKDVYSYLTIDVPINRKDNYICLHFIYEFEDRFTMPSNECFYNEETKELVFYELDDNTYRDFEYDLEQEINKVLQRDDILVISKNYVEIYYVNYKNEEYSKRYEFAPNKIVLEENNDEVFIRVKQSDNVAVIAKNIYEHIEEWNYLLDG